MSAKTKAKPRQARLRPTPPSEKLQPVLIPVSPAPSAFLRLSRLDFAFCVLLALATIVVYSRATRNPFVNYDDQNYVVENAHVQAGLNKELFEWALTSTYASNWHPLTWISHALDCQLFGLNPTGHHFTSVLLHLLNALILFLLLARGTGSTGRSLLVAALFALHPINVESVAWVAERKNVLSMLFLLLTVGAYGWYARRPNLVRYAATFLLFCFALASKPMVVTLPFLLFLLDFWPLRRVAGGPSASLAFPVPQYSFGRLAADKIPLLLLSAASGVITIVAQRSVISTNEALPLSVRMANAAYAYTMYLVKTLWPAHLASFYPYEGLRLASWQVWLMVLFLGGVTAWVWHHRTRPYLPVGWFWFLGSLVPMIGLVQVGDQSMADRYLYLPEIGIFLIIVWAGADFAQRRKLNLRWCVAAAALVLAVFSLVTWRQIGFWRSSYDLWSHALQVTKNNYMAEDYVGTALLLQNYETTGQRYSGEALEHFQNAVRINPRDPISRLNLGADFHERGRLREAMQQYQAVLGLTRDPHLLVKSLVDLGAVSHQLGDFAAGREYYIEALKMDPGNQTAFMNLGKLAMDEKIQELTRSASATPSAAAYVQLGQLQEAAEHIPEARASYLTALKLDPRATEARRALETLGR